MGKKGKRKAQQSHSSPCCSEACNHAVVDKEVLIACQRIFERESFLTTAIIKKLFAREAYKFVSGNFVHQIKRKIPKGTQFSCILLSRIG